jgi:hypothetical protein
MRIIVAGGRDFNNYPLLKGKLNSILTDFHKKGRIKSKEDIEIVSGHAKGADTLGEKYANEFGISFKVFIPDWNFLGKRAAYDRNNQMSKYAKQDDGVLVLFWNGISKGSKLMHDIAKADGLEMYVISY